jgi:hypothetical protein
MKRRLMAKKSTSRPDHRRVKLHRSYSVDEVARLFDMHPNTVRNFSACVTRPMRFYLRRGVVQVLRSSEIVTARHTKGLLI